MYVYCLIKLRARCQVGEDEGSELQDISNLVLGMEKVDASTD
jgi:hypothetical protein